MIDGRFLAGLLLVAALGGLAAWPLVRSGVDPVAACFVSGRLISILSLFGCLGLVGRIATLDGAPRRAGIWAMLLVVACILITSPVITGWFRPRPGYSDRAQPAGRDDAGVEAGEVQLPREAGVLDLETSVLHDLKAGTLGFGRSFVVTQAQLEPHDLGSDRDRLVDHIGQLVAPAEDIDDVGHDR